MALTSAPYVVFLVVVLAAYCTIRPRWQNALLLLASYAFYACWDVRFLAVLVLLTSVTFAVGRAIGHARATGDQRKATIGLVLGLTAGMGTLGSFKYFGFFVASAERLLTAVGLPLHLPVLELIMPAGLSFYAFQSCSYVVDVYRGGYAPTMNLVDYALYVAFFPKLLAGPIERANHLLPQIEAPRVVTQVYWDRGLYLILEGLVRKVVIADTAAAVANRFFEAPTSATSLQLAASLVLYSIQIYGDFSGYTNIARGSAMLFGFDLAYNFCHPYFARNVSDFWRRWHISLSTWFRDYVYIPLGGNRRGKLRTYVNLILTMALCGLWHGAGWNYVLWGLVHGLYLATHRALRSVWPERAGPSRWVFRQIADSVSGAVTFGLVTFAWLFFRVGDLATVNEYLAGLARFDLGGELILAPVLVLASLTLLVDLPQALTGDEYYLLRLPAVPRALAIGIGLLLLIVSGRGETAPFIYVQF